MKDPAPVSKAEFVKTLFSAYEELLVKAGGNPYIPIPAICKKLELRLDDFNRLLKETPKETPKYLIHLGQPMAKKSGGIRLGDTYFYYLAVFNKNKEIKLDEKLQ